MFLLFNLYLAYGICIVIVHDSSLSKFKHMECDNNILTNLFLLNIEF